MPVPETTIDEYRFAAIAKNNVGASCKVGPMQAKSITIRVKQSTHE
jgi:hypothetical protein